MGQHRMVVVNGQYPGFSGPPMTPTRARKIVDLLPAGTDLVAAVEMGYAQREAFGNALGQNWYREASEPSGGREGLNAIYWNLNNWRRIGGTWHRTLSSAGQWPRTLVMVRLEELTDPTAFVQAGAYHLAAKGSPLSARQADRAKWTQSHELREFIGNKRVIMGGDFPRTGDDDDLAYLKKEGVTFHGRTDRTPLAIFTRRGVTVLSSKVIESGSLLDHDLASVVFTIPGEKDA